jgi:hypothetical protein
VKAQGDGTFQGFKNFGTQNYLLIGGKVTVASHKNTFSVESGITYSIKEIEIVRWGSVVTEAQLKEEGSGDYPVLDLKGTEVPFGKLTVTPKEFGQGCGATWTITNDDEESCIVIAEDLSAKEHSDFDFNDAVFKVTKKGGKVSVTILAAGGELPIFIGNVNNENELHARFAKANEDRGITTKTMINTIDGDRSYATPTYELAEGEWDKTKTAINEIAASIKVTVYKSSQYVELLAPVGEAAAKLAVGTDYEWCDEWQGIDKKYDGKFTKYVGDETGTILWNKWYK